jgi:hypothetical protein
MQELTKSRFFHNFFTTFMHFPLYISLVEKFTIFTILTPTPPKPSKWPSEPHFPPPPTLIHFQTSKTSTLEDAYFAQIEKSVENSQELGEKIRKKFKKNGENRVFWPKYRKNLEKNPLFHTFWPPKTPFFGEIQLENVKFGVFGGVKFGVKLGGKLGVNSG